MKVLDVLKGKGPEMPLGWQPVRQSAHGEGEAEQETNAIETNAIRYAVPCRLTDSSATDVWADVAAPEGQDLKTNRVR